MPADRNQPKPTTKPPPRPPPRVKPDKSTQQTLREGDGKKGANLGENHSGEDS